VTEQQLEHVINAAAQVTGETEIVVVGSQAILGRFPGRSHDAARLTGGGPVSAETPRACRRHRRRPRRRLAVPRDLRLLRTWRGPGDGEGTEGLGATTHKGSRFRRPSGACHVPGLCLEPHDLVLAKAAVGRERDWHFVKEALAHDLVETTELLDRITDLPLPVTERGRVETMLRGIVSPA
jgi:hypothetical protein